LAVLVASGLYATAPSRYMIFPSLCLVWGMVVGAESLAGLAPPSWHATPTKASTVLAVLLLAVWLPGWFPNDSRSSGRDWGDALDAAAAECESMPDDKVVLVDSAPVDPDRPRQWSVPVPCSKLR